MENVPFPKKKVTGLNAGKMEHAGGVEMAVILRHTAEIWEEKAEAVVNGGS